VPIHWSFSGYYTCTACSRRAALTQHLGACVRYSLLPAISRDGRFCAATGRTACTLAFPLSPLRSRGALARGYSPPPPLLPYTARCRLLRAMAAWRDWRARGWAEITQDSVHLPACCHFAHTWNLFALPHRRLSALRLYIMPGTLAAYWAVSLCRFVRCMPGQGDRTVSRRRRRLCIACNYRAAAAAKWRRCADGCGMGGAIQRPSATTLYAHPACVVASAAGWCAGRAPPPFALMPCAASLEFCCPLVKRRRGLRKPASAERCCGARDDALLLLVAAWHSLPAGHLLLADSTTHFPCLPHLLHCLNSALLHLLAHAHRFSGAGGVVAAPCALRDAGWPPWRL